MAGNLDVAAMMAAIITAANAAALAQNAAAANAVVARPFARLPGYQNSNPLDFMKEADLKFFHRATDGLDEKFALKEDSLGTFLALVKDRANIYNWKTVVTVPDKDGVNRNLITNFGQVTIENCRDHVMTFAHLPNRTAQNDIMLYFFVVNSLTSDACLNVLGQEETYTNNIAGEVVPSGAMMLKKIIGISSIDTMAKVLLLRDEIAALPHKMVDLKGDVREFNLYAQRKRDDMLSRGQGVEELIAHLFRAYLQSPDENFVRYIQSKKDKYEEDGSVTADQLMALSLVKYDLIKQQNAAASEGEERVIAMRVSQTGSNSNNTISNDERFVAMETTIRLLQERLTQGGQGARGSNKKNKRNDAAHAWKKIKPKANETQTKVFSGRTYHWCRHHEAWTMHHPDECTLGNPHLATGTANAPQPTATGNYANATSAMLSMMYEEDSA